MDSRKLKLVIRCPEYGTRILRDPDAAAVCWMTRADFFDWIWSMPVAQVSEALDAEASWLCKLYKINRPTGHHWNRLRKGLDAPREPLDDTLPPDMPVPLVRFEWSGNGSYAVVPEPTPWTRLGGPDRSAPLYPVEEGRVPAALAVGSSGRPGRLWSRGPIGPLRPPSVREFRKLLWDTDPDTAIPHFALLGLSKREVAKIAKREGLRVPSSDWWSPDPHRSREPYPDSTRPKKFTQEQLDRTIDLSTQALDKIRSEVDADIAEEEAARLRRSEASLAAAARARARLDAGFDKVVAALVGGISGKEACIAASVPQASLQAELRRRLRAALAGEQSGTAEADNITGRLMRGTADRYEILLADHVCRRRSETGDQVQSSDQRYSERSPVTSIPELVRWLVRAEAVIEAQEYLADFVVEAPTPIENDDRGYPDLADRELGLAELAINPVSKKQHLNRAAHFATLDERTRAPHWPS